MLFIFFLIFVVTLFLRKETEKNKNDFRSQQSTHEENKIYFSVRKNKKW
jgi:hypothetical protein